MAMFGSGILGGFNKASSDYAQETVSDRNKMALQLKMLSALKQQQIEADEASAVSKFNREGMSTPAISALFRSEAGMKPEKGAHTIEQEKMLGGFIKSKDSVHAKALRGEGMTVAELEKAFNVKLDQYPDKTRQLNKITVSALRNRFNREEPTASEMKVYEAKVGGLKLLDSLWELRRAAVAELGSGPLKGRYANLKDAITQGADSVAVRTFKDSLTAAGTELARFKSETGVVTDQDREYASKVISGLQVDDEAARNIYSHARTLGSESIADWEDARPGLRRKREMDAAGKGIKSLYEDQLKKDLPSADDFRSWKQGKNKKVKP